MKLLAEYDRSQFDLTLDSELENIVGKRHDHSCVQFSTMTRKLWWVFPDRGRAQEAHDLLTGHPKLNLLTLAR